MNKVVEKYVVISDGVPAKISIEITKDYVPHYNLSRPKLDVGTEAILNEVKSNLIKEIKLSIKEFVDPKELERVKEKFSRNAEEQIKKLLPGLEEKSRKILIGNMLHEMVGLGDIEIMLDDENLEEIVINGSKEPVWVYHKRLGWLKSNITFESDDAIYNYSSSIARRVGKQISTLHPLLDAHLPSGDRANATIFPISTAGNTMTIRKFARSPWTVVDFLNTNTINFEVAALLWLCVQYEMSIIISGGTGSGKTSMLNVITPFIPPNQRIISIEDTREINLPYFLHWVPLTTREPNPEGKGGISMLDLLVNSLRMRPDRIIVGEIRRKRQAEVLFEAMHTGHSVYSTLHADTSIQTIRRLINPPISVPVTLLDAVDLNVVMYRDRRRNIRRVLEIAEIIPEYAGNEASPNILYRWSSRRDAILREGRSIKLLGQLELHAGLTKEEYESDLAAKIEILKYLVKKDIRDVNRVGKVVAEYYTNEDKVLSLVKKKALENILK